MEPRKRLIVDMDGVLADVYQQFINFEKRESGNTILLEDLNGVDEVKAFPNGEKHVRQKDFFRTAPIISEAQETLKQLWKCSGFEGRMANILKIMKHETV